MIKLQNLENYRKYKPLLYCNYENYYLPIVDYYYRKDTKELGLIGLDDNDNSTILTLKELLKFMENHLILNVLLVFDYKFTKKCTEYNLMFGEQSFGEPNKLVLS